MNTLKGDGMIIKEEDYEKALFDISLKIYADRIPATKEMDILIFATKKQIGKKVVKSIKYNNHRCPCCDNVISKYENYCSQCGQKLNWRI